MAHTSPMHVDVPTPTGPFTWDDFLALDGDATFAPPSFEGLAVPLGVLWRVVDELGGV
jgi:hypothetical protein